MLDEDLCILFQVLLSLRISNMKQIKGYKKNSIENIIHMLPRYLKKYDKAFKPLSKLADGILMIFSPLASWR